MVRAVPAARLLLVVCLLSAACGLSRIEQIKAKFAKARAGKKPAGAGAVPKPRAAVRTPDTQKPPAQRLKASARPPRMQAQKPQQAQKPVYNCRLQ